MKWFGPLLLLPERLKARLCFHCLLRLSTHTPPTQLLSSLTCFQGGGALLAADGPAAHGGAGAQVQLVFAQGFQVAQDPLVGVRVADVYGLQGAHFLRLVDWM